MPLIEKGKCPKCDSRLSRVNVEYAAIQGYKTEYKGINYVCPHCSAVLSVSIDPVALKNDLVSDLLKALGRG